jgi:hypothetical protein
LATESDDDDEIEEEEEENSHVAESIWVEIPQIKQESQKDGTIIFIQSSFLGSYIGFVISMLFTEMKRSDKWRLS